MALPPKLRHLRAMFGGWVCTMTNEPAGVLYIGVMADLPDD